VCRYLNDNASVDAVSSKLREVCPNLFRIEDAACSKVTALSVLNAATMFVDLLCMVTHVDIESESV
jgi:nuclear pore complex protein Nup155